MLQLRVKVDLGAMAIKGYSVFLKLQHYWSLIIRWFSVTSGHSLWWSYSSTEIQSVLPRPTGPLIDGVLPFYREAVRVFYSPSQLGKRVWYSLVALYFWPWAKRSLSSLSQAHIIDFLDTLLPSTPNSYHSLVGPLDWIQCLHRPDEYKALVVGLHWCVYEYTREYCEFVSVSPVVLSISCSFYLNSFWDGR